MGRRGPSNPTTPNTSEGLQDSVGRCSFAALLTKTIGNYLAPCIPLQIYEITEPHQTGVGCVRGPPKAALVSPLKGAKKRFPLTIYTPIAFAAPSSCHHPVRTPPPRRADAPAVASWPLSGHMESQPWGSPKKHTVTPTPKVKPPSAFLWFSFLCVCFALFFFSFLFFWGGVGGGQILYIEQGTPLFKDFGPGEGGTPQ